MLLPCAAATIANLVGSRSVKGLGASGISGVGLACALGALVPALKARAAACKSRSRTVACLWRARHAGGATQRTVRCCRRNARRGVRRARLTITLEAHVPALEARATASLAEIDDRLWFAFGAHHAGGVGSEGAAQSTVRRCRRNARRGVRRARLTITLEAHVPTLEAGAAASLAEIDDRLWPAFGAHHASGLGPSSVGSGAKPSFRSCKRDEHSKGTDRKHRGCHRCNSCLAPKVQILVRPPR